MSADRVEIKKQPLLSAIGGAMALIGFFMPWVACPAGHLSGANLGGILWLVSFSALGIVGAFLHFHSKGELAKARRPIQLCSLGAMALMILQWLRFVASEDSELFRLQFGAFFTLLGFAVALFGTTHLPPLPQGEARLDPAAPD